MNNTGNVASDGQHTGQKEEIRFAVVLNGGVSLAVWMGGVVRSSTVSREQGPTAGCGTARSQARADVISGTSAGGINGAVLAIAQANRNADVAPMRDLWSEQGRMDSLLQRPFRGSAGVAAAGRRLLPAQAVRGDEATLQAVGEPATAERPVELIITTTLLHGARTVSVDSLGQPLPQMMHRAYFTFRTPKRPGRLQDRPRIRTKYRGRAGDRGALHGRFSAGVRAEFRPGSRTGGLPNDQTDPRLSDPKQRHLGRYVSCSRGRRPG